MNTCSLERLEAALQVLQTTDPSPTSHPRFELHHFDCLPSTSQTLWELIEAGAPPGTVVIAAEQSAGRGQWGRQWQSNRGGLYLSVDWQPPTSIAESHLLTVCSGWGIAIALQERGIPVRLKWPNDLVLGDRKLGGILTQTRIRAGKIDRAVIGVGINWDNPVPETGINLRSFWQASPERGNSPTISSIEMLGAIVLYGLTRGMQYPQHQGIDSLVSAYEALLVNLGQSVAIEGNSGTVVGVDRSGNLKIRLTSDTGDTQPEIIRSPGTISLGYSNGENGERIKN